MTEALRSFATLLWPRDSIPRFGARSWQLLGVLVCLVLIAPAQAAGPKVFNLRFWHEGESTRVVLDVDSPLEFKTIFLQNPPRVVVDLPRGEYLGQSLPATNVGPWINAIRLGSGPKGDLMRFVFDLSSDVNFSARTLDPDGGRGYRIYMDFSALGSAPNVVQDSPANSTSGAIASGAATYTTESNTVTSTDNGVIVTPPSPPAPSNAPVAPTRSRKRSEEVIVIDAGHGGRDPGAVNKKLRQNEKEVTLAIARELARQINARPGMRAVMTRNSDRYVKLKDRQRIVDENQALVFISIHADGFTKSFVRGVSVYSLSKKGATSEEARRLADKENASFQFGDERFDDIHPEAQQYVMEAMMDITREWGEDLGRQVLKEMSKVAPAKFKTVEKANFQVLRVPQVAAILVETGFITNPKDAKALRSSKYHRKLAAAIVRGLEPFVRKNSGL